MFLAGMAAGALLALWLSLGPVLGGADAWWPFGVERLVGKLDLYAPSAPRGDAWGVVACILVALAWLCAWLLLRRDAVLLELDVARASISQEHARAIATADSHWEEAQRAERRGDDMGNSRNCSRP